MKKSPVRPGIIKSINIYNDWCFSGVKIKNIPELLREIFSDPFIMFIF